MTASQNQDQLSTSPEYHTDLPVGEILRRTRVHYNQTLQDVAGYMRIRASQLEAIEKGEVEKLPGQVYAIGYVRTYSEYLGLDGEKMVQLFKQQSLNRTMRPELHFPVAASESKAPNFFILFASLGVLVLVLGVWMVMNNNGGKDTADITDIPNVPADMRSAIPPVPAVVPSAVATAPAATATAGAADPAAPANPAALGNTAEAHPPAPNAVATDPAVAAFVSGAEQPATAPVSAPAANATADAGGAAPAETAAATGTGTETANPPAAPAEDARQIVITVRERSWVEVRDKQNKAILSRILKPGEVFIVPEENYGLKLDTGNAGGLELTVNGKPIPPLGKSGDILRSLVLDGGQLVNRGSAASQ